MSYLIAFLQLPLYVYFIAILATPMEIIDLTAQFLTLVSTPPHGTLFLPHLTKCILALAGFIVAYSFFGLKAIYVNLTGYQNLIRDNTIASADTTVVRTTNIDKAIDAQDTCPAILMKQGNSEDEHRESVNKIVAFMGDSDAGGNDDLPMHSAAQSIDNNVFSATGSKVPTDNKTAGIKDSQTTTITVTLPNTLQPVDVKMDAGSFFAASPSSQAEVEEPSGNRAISTDDLIHNDSIKPVDQMTKDENSADHVIPASLEKEKDTDLDRELSMNGEFTHSTSVDNVTPTVDQTLSLYAFPPPPHQQVLGSTADLSLRNEESNNDIDDSAEQGSSDNAFPLITTATIINHTTVNTEPVSEQSQQDKPQFLADIIEPTNGAFISSLTENLERILDKSLTPRTSPDDDSKNTKPILEIPASVEQTTTESNPEIQYDNNIQHPHIESTPSLTPQDQPSSAANSSFSRRSSTISQLSTTAASTTNKLHSALQKVVSRSGTKQSLQQQVPQHSVDDEHTFTHSIPESVTNKKKHRFSTIRLNKRKSIEVHSDRAEEKPVNHSSDIAVPNESSAAVVIPRKSVSTRLQKGFKNTGKRLSRIFT